MPLLFTVYLAACVESLLSVALFGCNFSIDKNLAIVAFTQFIFQNPTALSTGTPLYADSNDILPKTIYAVVGENEAIEYELTPYFVAGDGADAVLVAWDCMPTIRLGEKDYHPYEELICLSIEDADAERQRIIDSCELIGRIESVIDSVYMPKNSLEANFAGVKDEIYKSGNEYYLVLNSPLESNGRYTYAQKLSIDE